ncbi:MAG TPA: sensor histidine kinase [Longimicrobiaceae bacterium]|nr:sensor histidine kinase [Longimicrobiaceae bacterium]
MDRTPAPSVSFEQFSADRLRRDSGQITRRWVERLSSQLGIRPRRVLPTDDLLDSIPPVLGRAAEFLVAPEENKITGQKLVTDEMREIARLRRRQGYDVQEIIREFDELAEILDEAALRWLDEYGGTPDSKSVGRVFGRLNRAPLLMGEVTVGVYREEELESRHTTARRLREFAETLMHQLKTPLGAAEGAALLLENDEITSDPAERRRFAGMIQRNLSRARTVVDDVRALALAQLAQARAGRFLKVAEVVGEVLAEVRPLAEESGVRLEVQEPVPDLVVDASRVEIVLHNLIGNAVKYADPAKPERWVRISFSRPPGSGEWWVEVADNGLGIPLEMQGRIFDRFFRAHPEAAEGSGLGLAIVREAVQQLGSRLEFDSEPGQGTTFCFPLPPAEEEEERA